MAKIPTLPTPSLWQNTLDLTPATYPPGGTLLFPSGAGTGGGSVTSVAVTSADGSVTVTGSPITTAGTIDLSVVPGMSAGTLWRYNAKTTATSGYPGNGYMLWDNATQISATHLLLSHLTDDNLDIDLLLGALVASQVLIIQDANDSANYQKWTLTGSGVNTNGGTATSYWTYPVTLISSAGTGTTNFPNNHSLIVFVLGAGTAGAAGGDLSGTYPNPTVAKINTVALGSTTATAGNVLVGSGTQWVTKAVSGDATLASTGALTVANSAITNAKLANMAAHTIKANITGSAAAPVDSSLSAILDAEVSSTQGVIIYRGASAWSALSPGTDNSYFLATGGSGANPSWLQPSATGGAGFVTAIDLDFSTQSNQTLGTDTTFTIGGYTWTKANSANDATAMAVVNGSGLVIQPKSTSNYNGTTRTAPYLYLDLASIIPSYYMEMPLRIWFYLSADNITASGDAAGAALDNLSSSSTTICSMIGRKINGGSYQFGGAISAASETFSTEVCADRVTEMSMPTGRWSSALTMWSGAYSSGWPAVSAIRPVMRIALATSTLATSADIVTGLPMKFVLFAQRNTSVTALSCTIARIRIDYKVT